MSEGAISGVLVVVGLVVFGLVLFVRRVRPGLAEIDAGPASAVLSYTAATFGILVGFVIVFLLGQTANARQAIGDEATSIGTAFDEAQLFPEAEPAIQHALICYSRAVSEVEWPQLAEGRSAAEADDAYRELVAAYDVDLPSGSSFQSAAATNSFVQIGGISTARETRLVAAESSVGGLMWGLLIGAAAFVLLLLFVVSLSARPLAQAVLLGLAGVFTAVLLILVAVLSSPFQDGAGPLTSRLIDENTERMATAAPEVAARRCPFDEGA